MVSKIFFHNRCVVFFIKNKMIGLVTMIAFRLLAVIVMTFWITACSEKGVESKEKGFEELIVNSIDDTFDKAIEKEKGDDASINEEAKSIQLEKSLSTDQIIRKTEKGTDKKLNESDWWSPGEERDFPSVVSYPNATGIATTFFEFDHESEPFQTKDHPFFSAIGNNGRACVTCHQPADGMSLTAETAKKRWKETDGTDPLFSAIDGSDCPHLPQERESSHSLLINHGLFRIFRPWPPLPVNGVEVEPQFDIEVVRDPTGCNTHSIYGLNSLEPMVSVYRRPRPATNLKYITSVGFPFEPKNGLPLPIDPLTGEMVSGNITADSRVWTLREQAIDALKSHMEYSGEIDESVIEQIIVFETKIFTAQSVDFRGGDLTDAGAKGGPEFLAKAAEGVLNSGTRLPMWDEYESWLMYLGKNYDDLSNDFPALTKEQFEFRQSVARGVKFFRDVTFLVKDNAGITDMGFGNPVRNDCNFCHNMTRSGMDVAPGQVDLGTTNLPFSDPAPHLPLFKLTCKEGYAPHAHLGKTVLTSDPGFALTTGRCKDIGKITIQSMRGLAARAPYFSNGSAESIRGIVDYYARRYNITMTEQQKIDLTNLMSVL
ncbi:MAG: hypothetical protein ACRBCS_13870 [Cellvibrionaceae bacterium]